MAVSSLDVLEFYILLTCFYLCRYVCRLENTRLFPPRGTHACNASLLHFYSCVPFLLLIILHFLPLNLRFGATWVGSKFGSQLPFICTGLHNYHADLETMECTCGLHTYLRCCLRSCLLDVVLQWTPGSWGLADGLRDGLIELSG